MQGFFAQLIAREGLRHVDPAKGRFRSFMLASLRNFMADERDRAHAAKRGGGTELMPLDFAVAEEAFEQHFASSESPSAFERPGRWRCRTRTPFARVAAGRDSCMKRSARDRGTKPGPRCLADGLTEMRENELPIAASLPRADPRRNRADRLE